MRIVISGRHLEITDAIRDYAEKKITRIKKYFDHIVEMDITLSAEHSKVDGKKHTADVLLFVNGNKIKAKAVAVDLYAAIDEVHDILENQVVKYKEKLKNRQHHQINVKEAVSALGDKPELDVADTTVVKSKLISPKPMSIEEAILQMDAMKQGFYAFMNHETQQMNVVYRIKGGGYGHIEPSWK